MSISLSIIYLIATVSFIVGLKKLGNPSTAKNGNLIAAAGMGLAIAGTIFIHDFKVPPLIYILIGLAILIGSIIGGLMAFKVKMTKMPELVSLFNGFGGSSAALIGLVEISRDAGDKLQAMTIVSGIIIGAITFSGSMIAWGKLNGSLKSVINIPYHNIVNNLFFIGVIAFGAYMVTSGGNNPVLVVALLASGLLYGILFVLPIGGADMPVVISLLNSLTGIAAAITGVLYSNMVMLIGGILVGSAGIILTIAMCKGMNRTLGAVIFGAFGGTDAASDEDRKLGSIKKTNPSDSAIMMNYASNVIIVPGYGLAVAQAQHVIHELEEILTEKGVDVKYAIHPVAGRMPGHMNVLLAESNVDYSLLVEMEDINSQFKNTDVVLVVGANDVVNPAAHNDPSSPIYGMPILDVENAKHIIVNKRTMNAGYAGIENELFYNDKTVMLFGDAKDALTKLVSELKNM
ncbi:NAD(P)(+) transhydrogenase (Re/Si-specific) subunit beta [uncultured Eudoraea sp.]|uniref:NAD(P)(+) transhydrogenase (Re/Si-specific) subunit beta n=1 Tax=uncultured Eudoraea sp. TaxID=1035614 RepID=UPI0026064D37|nr:NAD(P)(+) transhydrogenase (Re/Si-specific) subunit beta [uncultured Eudoraea sp.]